VVQSPKGRPDTQTDWSTVCRPQEELQLQILLSDLQLVLLSVFDTTMFTYVAKTDFGAHAIFCLSLGCPGVKRLGLEAYHSLATEANVGLYTRLHGVVLS
jgi:hypothetical protein